MPEFQRLNGIPENIGKEWMSLAYLRAICAQVGLNMSRAEFDNGIDWYIGSIPSLNGESLANSFLAIQLKATQNWQVEDGGFFKYNLPIKNYNLLRTESRSPQYLVVFTLPSNLESWIKYQWESVDHEHIIELRHMAYYLNLRGLPATDNQESITIQIPVSNKLTSQVLGQLYREHVQSELSWVTNQRRNGQ
jgi:hypothetical protein